MKASDVYLLKTKIDNGTVKIRFVDGEEVLARILSVSESEQDIIFDVISTNLRQSVDRTSARLARFQEINSV